MHKKELPFVFEPGVQHPGAVGLRAVSLQLLAPGEPFTTHGAVKRKLPQVDRLDVLLLRKTHCLNFFFSGTETFLVRVPLY